MVRVTVENVDEPPIFSSPLSKMVISEAAKVGTIIGTVSALDPDTTNSPIRYDMVWWKRVCVMFYNIAVLFL